MRLTGSERDLRLLASAIRNRWQVTEKDGKFYLRSNRFKGLSEVEAKHFADKFLDEVNLAALVRFAGYLLHVHTTGEIVCIEPDGSRSQHTILTLETGSLTIRGFPAGPPPDLTRDWSLLRRRRRLAAAIRDVREQPDWFGYWNAVEALGQDISGSPSDRVVDLGWASQDEWNRFEETVHHHRHPHSKPAPENRMSKPEAEAFLLDLLRKCLDWHHSKAR